eukprot:snap_masked-scaffold415_size178368-processed-gene-0.20 protein:Tk01180 transcript:snap_masked-scaffold415_size178368-processed-gene-0.20-mRNA-1 annotation:"hypothetical protein TcasGA2_TC004525"
MTSEDWIVKILVEFEDLHWDKREWLRVYKDHFHTFKTLVDNVHMSTKSKYQPVEFLVDGKLDFQVYDKLKIIWGWDPTIPNLFMGQNIEGKVREWVAFRDTQHILVNVPFHLVGERLKVYRAEGTTQWFSAISQKYKQDTQEYVMIDDIVLQEHREDPQLLQMGFHNLKELEYHQNKINQGKGSSSRSSRSSTQRTSLQFNQSSNHLPASSRSQSSSNLTNGTSKKRSSRNLAQSTVSSPYTESSANDEEDTPLAIKKRLKTRVPTAPKDKEDESEDARNRKDTPSPARRPRGRPKGSGTRTPTSTKATEESSSGRLRPRSMSSTDSSPSGDDGKFKAPVSGTASRKLSTSLSASSVRNVKSNGELSPTKRVRRCNSTLGLTKSPSEDTNQQSWVNSEKD